MNSLKDTIIISLAAVAFMIAVHRTMVEGLYENYWIFMVSLGLFIWYRYNRKTAAKPVAPPERPHIKTSKTLKKKKQK